MKNLLLAVSTQLEVEPLFNQMDVVDLDSTGLSTFYFKDLKINVLITGVGMVAMAYHLTRSLYRNKYDYAINAGIGGCFDRRIPIGTVLNVASEEFPELGAEAGERFINVFELGLVDPNNIPFRTGKLLNENLIPSKLVGGYDNVPGITVNTVLGNELSIGKVFTRHNPVIESMEGGAFMFCMINENIPFAEIRSVSNYVEKRNKSDWNIPLAIHTLNQSLIAIFADLSGEEPKNVNVKLN